ncbi:MAG: T9SS type B sorting domain-containing protein [Bacteroidota bacterium]
MLVVMVCRKYYFPRFFILSVALLLTFAARAQLCSGSLGDPVVNITFGSGSGSDPTGYAPTSSYVFTSSSCPNDGFYTITNYSSNCFGNSWHTVSSDHTGGGGYMLVNASYAPGDFFLTTVSNLCPNTTYEFAAWILNIMRPVVSIRPNITLNIETPSGTLLGTYNTGDIDVTGGPEWKQYGFFFTTPPGNAVIVLRMTNNAPGGIGNDLALDDITFRPCGAKIDANIQGNADTIDLCEGNTNTYKIDGAVSSAYQSPLYQWQLSTDKGATWKDIPSATTISYTRSPTGAGNYWYRLSVIESSVASISSCRIASNIVIINIHSKPLVDAGPDRIILTGNSTTLNGKAEGESITYQWDPPTDINSITDLNPIVSPTSEITYTLSAQSIFGCPNQDNVEVKVVKGIYVPTAFTPNNDGKNDAWKIPYLDPAFGGIVSVFNRFGQTVYHCEESIVSWDGKMNGMQQPPGTYVYLVTFKKNSLILKGTVTLIR